MILYCVLAFVAGCVVTALAAHLKPKNALEQNYEYLKRKYAEATGQTPPSIAP